MAIQRLPAFLLASGLLSAFALLVVGLDYRESMLLMAGAALPTALVALALRNQPAKSNVEPSPEDRAGDRRWHLVACAFRGSHEHGTAEETMTISRYQRSTVTSE